GQNTTFLNGQNTTFLKSYYKFDVDKYNYVKSLGTRRLRFGSGVGRIAPRPREQLSSKKTVGGAAGGSDYDDTLKR
ncbi:hypothetical protein, partial [Burkholderia ubonensis]|uniref:hypothetical protein n=1 Tax=Burkholderia ubonensis TaxID=101571 RepID=UPI001E5216C5